MPQHIANLDSVIFAVIISTLIILLYGILILNAIKKYNVKSLSLEERVEEMKLQQEKLILETELEIQEQTFQFISKEIHDNITQGLSLAKLNLNVIDIKNLPETCELIVKSKNLIAKALNDLNHLSKSLDSDLIESHGLIPAIHFEIERWARISKNKISLSVSGIQKFLDTKSELLIFRIIQESINNIVKYACAENIEIAIYYKVDTIQVSIKDDGIGFDDKQVYVNRKIGEKAGLKNMRQRAEMMNGNLYIHSKYGEGTTIEILIPTNKISKYDKSSIGR